ncbi:MAG: hypothetical protein NTY53_24760 [Kiritimatiellaeota bacterium]|nr:hypothetical protein [Kiritimatiellota bacterium]
MWDFPRVWKTRSATTRYFHVCPYPAPDGRRRDGLSRLLRHPEPVHQRRPAYQRAFRFHPHGQPARYAMAPDPPRRRVRRRTARRAHDAAAILQAIEEFLRRAGISALRVEGQEADDTMASFAALATADNTETLLATSDKDLFQMVTDRVAIVAPTVTGGRMGPAEVCAKMGVPPRQIVELLALTGDTVDNIPGVPGVGPKTAAKLLTDFGSLEGLWERLDAVAGAKTRAALAAHRAEVERNVQLIRLRTDLVERVDWDALRIQPADVAALRSFYQEMELHSLERDLDSPAAPPPAPPSPPPKPKSDMQLNLF